MPHELLSHWENQKLIFNKTYDILTIYQERTLEICYFSEEKKNYTRNFEKAPKLIFNRIILFKNWYKLQWTSKQSLFQKSSNNPHTGFWTKQFLSNPVSKFLCQPGLPTPGYLYFPRIPTFTSLVETAAFQKNPR